VTNLDQLLRRINSLQIGQKVKKLVDGGTVFSVVEGVSGVCWSRLFLATSSELALEGELVGRRRNGRALGLEF
jgi:hypothetical protein